MPRIRSQELLDDIKGHWSSHLVIILISAMTFVVVMGGGFSISGIRLAFERGWHLFVILLLLGFALRFIWQGLTSRSD